MLPPIRHFEFHFADAMMADGVMFVRHAGSFTLFSIAAAQMGNVEI
jgi:hypothetical protein